MEFLYISVYFPGIAKYLLVHIPVVLCIARRGDIMIGTQHLVSPWHQNANGTVNIVDIPLARVN